MVIFGAVTLSKNLETVFLIDFWMTFKIFAKSLGGIAHSMSKTDRVARPSEDEVFAFRSVLPFTEIKSTGV